MEIKVIKIGGGIMDTSSSMNNFLKSFSKIKGPKILVHGGGKGANAILEKLGIKPKMINGRRVTDKETLKVVTQLYSGLYNKEIVAKLQSLNTNALGLSGADGKMIISKKREVGEIDYGFVGDPILEKVNTGFLELLLSNNITPVFCAITVDASGHLLNTNADTIASTLSIALAKKGNSVNLCFCFDKIGVLRDITNEKTIIKSINFEEYKNLVEEGIIIDGMKPKLENAFNVIQKGVKEVVLCHPKNIDTNICTKISNN